MKAGDKRKSSHAHIESYCKICLLILDWEFVEPLAKAFIMRHSISIKSYQLPAFSSGGSILVCFVFGFHRNCIENVFAPTTCSPCLSNSFTAFCNCCREHGTMKKTEKFKMEKRMKSTFFCVLCRLHKSGQAKKVQCTFCSLYTFILTLKERFQHAHLHHRVINSGSNAL